MKQHPDWCDKYDDPRALLLWGSDRPARLAVVCPKRHHRLAAVYDIGTLGGLVLCQPPFSGMARDFFALDDDDPRAGEHIHYHAELQLLDEIDPGEMSPYGRCHCHTWSYRLDDIRAGLERPGGTLMDGTAFIYARLSVAVRRLPADYRHRNGIEFAPHPDTQP